VTHRSISKLVVAAPLLLALVFASQSSAATYVPPAQTVPVYLNVFCAAPTSCPLPLHAVDAQVRQLNQDYAGTGFSFLAAATFFRAAPQFASGITPGSPAERAMKSTYNAQTVFSGEIPDYATGYTALNVYITGLGPGLTGWATFPTAFTPPPAAVSQDGIVISAGSVGPEQETLSREVAYWLGLPVDGCWQLPDAFQLSGWQLDALLFNTTNETCEPTFTTAELIYLHARYSQRSAVPSS